MTIPLRKPVDYTQVYKAWLHIELPSVRRIKIEEVILGNGVVGVSDSFPPFIGDEAQKLFAGETITVNGRMVWLTEFGQLF